MLQNQVALEATGGQGYPGERGEGDRQVLARWVSEQREEEMAVQGAGRNRRETSVPLWGAPRGQVDTDPKYPLDGTKHC